MTNSLRILAIALAFFAGSAVAQTSTYTLYILPPSDESWLLGTPYLKVGNRAAERLEMDTTYCGWFYKTYNTSASIPEDDAWVWLGAQKADQFGVSGLAEDPADWVGGNPTPINIKAQFDSLVGTSASRRLYFFATEGRWAANLLPAQIPEEKKRCEYEFAAIIYQRTAGNGGGFSWYGVNSPGQTNATQAYGICKGIVKDVLDTNGKMQFNNMNCQNAAPYAPNPNGSNWDAGTQDQAVAATNFYNAFKETTGQNTMKCWNMPFQKRPSGLWEFDAYYLCKDGLPNNPHMDYTSTTTRGCGVTGANAGNVGGFYPGFGYNGAAGGGLNRPFNGDRVGVKKTHEWCFDRGWDGQSATGVVGNLSGLTTRAALDNEMKRVCGSGAALYPTTSNIQGTEDGLISSNVRAHDLAAPNGYGTATNVIGGHLCFESQNAEFTYEPGQEFFFRGDDDIWVFVSNYLAVDLGGTHMPAPGYLKMDTLRVPQAARIKDRQYGPQGQLVEGQKYPIKIFFCDRRGTGSNVRISTNMYFYQKSGLSLKEGTAQILGDVCLESSGGGSCEAAAGSAGNREQCGADLKGKLNYYITKPDGSGRVNLSDAFAGCARDPTNSNLLKCYESIVIDDNGKVQVGPVASGLVGTYVVYAEVKENVGISPIPAPLRLGTTSGRTYIQVVWGEIVDSETKTPIVNIPFKTDVDGKVGMEAVASKLIPVGFAQGGWILKTGGPGDSTKANTSTRFEVDVSAGRGQNVRLENSSFRDLAVKNSTLIVYEDSLGTVEVDWSKGYTIPSSGVLVLWFTGVFEADSTATYGINSRAGGDPFALKVHQPKVEFLYADDAIIPVSDRYGSDPAGGEGMEKRGVYVGTGLSRKIAAYDPVDGGICTTCSFDTRHVVTQTSVISGGIEEIDNRVIEFNEKKVVNGIGNLNFSGVIPVENDSVAFFTVGGPSPDINTLAKWDSLQFIKPPIPFPTSASIFDRNGDGKGDEIVVVYDRKFPPNKDLGIPDTLPNKLQIVWAIGDTISFGLGQADANGKYDNLVNGALIDPVANWAYWERYVRPGVCLANEFCPDTIVIALPTEGHEALAFSKEIKTAAYGGENVFSWSTFRSVEGIETKRFERKIADKIPPIIVKADYQGDKDTKCGDATNRCYDRLFLEFSEKIRMAEGVVSSDNVKRAFAYNLMIDPDTIAGFKVYEESRSLANTVMWGKKLNFPEYEGDSSVQLTYWQYKTSDDNSYTPIPNDSVRFLAGNRNIGTSAEPTEHAFQDLEGNYPNPMEIGRKIEGKGRLNTDRNLISEVDVNDQELKRLKDKMREKFGYPGSGGFAEKIETLFPPERPMEFLPIPESWKDIDKVRDSIAKYYPGTVGVAFWPSVKATLSDSKYKDTKPEDISFVANSFYHTNLGNFVVRSKGPDGKDEVRVRCDDPIFQIDGEEDCRNSNGLYLAWDLKDNKNRIVGSGAYVQVYNFRWEIENVDKADRVPNKYPGSGNKIEMFGVKRVKSRN
jgi:fibro-slime domain-containing protein